MGPFLFLVFIVLWEEGYSHPKQSILSREKVIIGFLAPNEAVGRLNARWWPIGIIPSLGGIESQH